MTTTLTGCSFFNTTSNGDGGGGGGVSVYYEYSATNVTTTLTDCSFSNTTSNGEGGGGGVSVCYGYTATDVTTTIADSNFTGCSATGGDGGTIAVSVARAGGGLQPSAFFLRLNDFFTLPSTSTSTPWLRMMMYCWVKVMVLLATQ